MKEKIEGLAIEFDSKPHGSSDYWRELCYVRVETQEGHELFLPFSVVSKSFEEIKESKDLLARGHVLSSLTYLELKSFDQWYQKSFNRKISLKDKKCIEILHEPDATKVGEVIEIVNQVYEILRAHKVLVNGKNLPVQLGEWYAKMIFGLHQMKSASQRGFDFFTPDKKKVEVNVHWHDVTSPKGVKLKQSLLVMSDYTIIMYVAKNFMIRDILFLDSAFVIRKFANKGHTIFLKDSDILTYFFSRSNKHYEKIINRNALMKFATPKLAMKIHDKSLEMENQNSGTSMA